MPSPNRQLSPKEAPSSKESAASNQKESVAGEQFPIVGVGASAGGLEAFTKLLERLPVDTGMAFVFIQHLAPGQESMLTDILGRSTRMPVHRVQNDMPVEPNTVYVIPPGVSMTISDKVLKLQRDVSRVPRPIDQFLISLAQDAKNLAIGVILSGTGSDGTEGLKAIYAEGGLTFAQDENSAKYSGMPHSAVASQSVHFVLTPEKVADELMRIGEHPYLNHTELKIVQPRAEEENAYKSILALLKLAFNVNFSAYKESTINRRISRRMVIHQVDKMEDYVKLLRNDRSALQALFDDLLIGVTSFFREPETFEVLCETVYPAILKDKSPETTIRVWVPGCATGEEVYSLAISLREYSEKTGVSTAIQIFGTDISEKNIEKARSGVYPEAIAENVSEARLKHFFNRVDQTYQISKSIRDMCVFAKQDLTRDPPFSNLDLISCRNVLIYLKPEAQKRVIPLFHYALRPNAFLVLGKSESISGYDELFSPIDKAAVFLRKIGSVRMPMEIEMGAPFESRQDLRRKTQIIRPLDSLKKEVELILMGRFSPPGVVVNNDLDVLLFHGNTAQYLAHSPGTASLDLMKMLRDELRLELQTAIYIARKQNSPVKRDGIQFKHDNSYSQVDLEVIPIESPQTSEKFFLILFESTFPLAKKHVVAQPSKQDTTEPMIEELKRELASTKENLQTIIEEQEATNEELRAALEEVQSSNEELQSTNEELETSKEELQSTNEELNTLNEELNRRHKELNRVHDDLTNLFTNIDVTVIVLDPALRIRLFTPAAERTFRLIQADIGRPIIDISLGIPVENFEVLLREVMENLSSKQMKVQDKKGKWFEMRLRPYLTAEKKIDGVVLSFIDIDAMVRSRAEIEKSRKFADTVLATMQEPLVVLDADLKVVTANPSFYETFQIDADDTMGRNIYKIGDKGWQSPEFKNALEKAASEGDSIEDLVIDHNFQRVGRKVLSISGRLFSSDFDGSRMIVLTLQDVTHRKQVEERLVKNKQDLETEVEDKGKQLQDAQRLAVIGQIAGMVGHDIRNPLQSIVSSTYLLKDEILSSPEGQTDEQKRKEILESVDTIEEQAQYIEKIVSDLQEFSRPLTPRKEEVDFNLLVKSFMARTKIPNNINVEIQTDNNLKTTTTDPTCVTRIFTNLVTNAIQAMPNGGTLTIKTLRQDGKATLTVQDTGEGIPDNIKPKLFQPLVTSKSKGQGFGLAVVKRLVEALKGDITFESERGKGTKFIVKLPTET